MTGSPSSEAPKLEDLPLEGSTEQQQEQTTTDTDLPPLRLHATRVPERLSGSSSSLQAAAAAVTASTTTTTTPGTPRGHVRRKSSGTSKSPRSASPSVRAGDTEANSSVSSLDDDSDILTDRMGFQELDVEKQRLESQVLHTSTGSLNPVNERLSEDTLEDVRAFSDVGTHSRGTSIATGDVGSFALETLDEEDEEDDDDEAATAKATKIGVHISNIETLPIHEEGDDDDDEEQASLESTSEQDLPPLHLHATRGVSERLSSSTSSLNYHTGGSVKSTASGARGSLGGRRRKSRRGSGRRARSLSPFFRALDGGDASSTSSLEDVDSDILLDRMGFQELDVEEQRAAHEILHTPSSSLGAVAERLSEDTLEDTQAFHDITKSSVGTHSRGTSIATTGDLESHALETLDEAEEEEDATNGNNGQQPQAEGIHISNMENLAKKEEAE